MEAYENYVTRNPVHPQRVHSRWAVVAAKDFK